MKETLIKAFQRGSSGFPRRRVFYFIQQDGKRDKNCLLYCSREMMLLIPARIESFSVLHPLEEAPQILAPFADRSPDLVLPFLLDPLLLRSLSNTFLSEGSLCHLQALLNLLDETPELFPPPALYGVRSLGPRIEDAFEIVQAEKKEEERAFKEACSSRQPWHLVSKHLYLQTQAEEDGSLRFKHLSHQDALEAPEEVLQAFFWALDELKQTERLKRKAQEVVPA